MQSNTYYPPGTVCAVDLSTARKFSLQQSTSHQEPSMSGNTARRPQRKIFKKVIIKLLTMPAVKRGGVPPPPPTNQYPNSQPIRFPVMIIIR